MYEGQLKAVSFLPMGNKTYPQQPYSNITREEYNSYVGKIGQTLFGSNSLTISRKSRVPVFIIPKNYRYKKMLVFMLTCTAYT